MPVGVLHGFDVEEDMKGGFSSLPMSMGSPLAARVARPATAPRFAFFLFLFLFLFFGRFGFLNETPVLFGGDALMTRGTIDETALMFSLLFPANHQFLTGDTFAPASTDTYIHGVHDFSLVGSAQVLLEARLPKEFLFAGVTWEQG